MNHSPIFIRTLLHIYCLADRLPDNHATDKAVVAMLESGLIEGTTGGCLYRCTERGHVFVRMILETPLPVPSFIDPRTKP